MGKFIQEFKEFALKGNVMDMAVGIIIGGAFGKIVSSLVNDIIMPPIGLITGSSFEDAKVVLRAAEVDTTTGETLKEAITLNWGSFVQTTVDFFIIALCIFLLIKAMNSFRKKKEEEPAAPAPTPEDIELLREIRDELKRRG
ncbi:large-conductance mechanosensitive channel protein MscL [Porphyromonas catoniae]|jgi:large conductance mechanosensitive channel protein|uniref:Large-conductance mechanosensitive channel n=2 Tax=Porphyromonas catoniae TaxID=41976 RepID=Z4WQB4_9PORP|nr:large-conductance mechanosensitive channel protein MscL [Porphyromonas catoniae]EKY02271.1 large conductance mechanosensitive channel protein [Porphyromonas catoniae F0037]EWC91453.1 large conductance mechanosensitive channel protein [Porphyromonas catoniae ATCC 51270]